MGLALRQGVVGQRFRVRHRSARPHSDPTRGRLWCPQRPRAKRWPLLRARRILASTSSTSVSSSSSSALLLAYLFFAVGLEQRTSQVGVLAAIGFSARAIRRAFFKEAIVLAALGAALGAVAAIGYSALILYGLRTWWIGAVGTTSLTLHVPAIPAGDGHRRRHADGVCGAVARRPRGDTTIGAQPPARR